METITLTDTERAMLASVASGLAGGRHAFRVKDSEVKSAARDAVVKNRRHKRNADKRAAYAERIAAERRAAMFNGYATDVVCEAVEHTDTCCRFGNLIAVWKRTPKRSAIKSIARAILADTDKCRDCDVDGVCPRHTVPADWRDTVRAFRDGRALSREVGGFALSRDDMRADSRSRFYRNVVKHWHDYADGKHCAIHGATPDDVAQDALLAALESRDGLTFGGMYAHARMATERAVYVYRRMGNGHSDNVTTWTWTDWEAWARENNVPDNLSHSTLPEWAAFEVARDMERARVKRSEAATLTREIRARDLSEARKSLAALVMGGMTVRRIAHVLGRTPEGILKDLESSQELPVSFA